MKQIEAIKKFQDEQEKSHNKRTCVLVADVSKITDQVMLIISPSRNHE